jgi:Fur family transcriptional regulator, ferric uptake regulator
VRYDGGNVKANNELRLPANHRVVLDVVREGGPGTHLGAHDVMVRARRIQPRLGLATVHRALTRLTQLGLVSKVDVPGMASATYEPAASQHAHFACTVCGAVSDVDYALPKRTLGEIGGRHGIEITGEALTLFGRCADCR